LLAFIVALKSKQVSNDWDKVRLLFEATLASAYRQIDPDFRIIVVCHERPELEGRFDSRVEFIQVDFPPPDIGSYVDRNLDKHRKYHVAKQRVLELRPDFVMILDADDLVSRRLTAFVNKRKGENGWVIQKGYRWHEGSKWLRLVSNHNQVCASSHILNFELVTFPAGPGDNSESVFRGLTGHNHREIDHAMKGRGRPLGRLPFPGAIYLVGHGEGNSDLRERPDSTGMYSFLKNILKQLIALPQFRYFRKTLREEFSMGRE
jgi:hypothetical protein